MSVFVGEENSGYRAIPFCDDPDVPAGVVGRFVSGKDTVIAGADSFVILMLITVTKVAPVTGFVAGNSGVNELCKLAVPCHFVMHALCDYERAKCKLFHAEAPFVLF